MAAIGEIRKRSGVVIIIIGVAILAFVLSDLLRSNRSLFREGRSNAVGVVNGKKITHQAFRQRVQQTKQQFQRQRQLQEVNDRMMATVQKQAWDQLVFDNIFRKEQADLGLYVTEQELYNLVQGDDPHPAVKRTFKDPETGEFNRQRLDRLQQQLKRGLPSQANERQAQQFRQQKEQWIRFEQNLKQQRQKEKYFNLIRKSFYVTDLQAKRQYLNKNKLASIQYITLQKRQVADSAVNVTDEAISQYYEKHQSKYETGATRTIEYVVFDVKPTSKDSMQVAENLRNIKADFRKRKNDSSFVALQSDEPYDSTYLAPKALPEAIRDSVIGSETGMVFGPYTSDKGYQLSKVIDAKEGASTYYKASHILFRPEGNTRGDTLDAESKAKEISRKIQGGADFVAMASKYNDDPAAGDDGNLGWFADGKMVPPFMEGIKAHDKGDVFTVNTKFGTHIVKVTAEPINKQYKLGTIVRNIYPGDKTYEEVYGKASQFRSQITSPDDFDKVVREAGLNKQIAEGIKPSKRLIPGLDNATELVRWAYSNKEGTLSGILELGDQYVIARLTNVMEKGVQPLDAVKNEIRAQVLDQRKAKKLLERFKTANSEAGNLKAIARQLNQKVKSASGLKFSRSAVPNLSNSNAVVGTTFGLKEGLLSTPFTGERGAYQLKLTSLQEADPPETLVSTKEELRTNMVTRAQSKIVESLKEMAEIKDMRYKFN